MCFKLSLNRISGIFVLVSGSSFLQVGGCSNYGSRPDGRGEGLLIWHSRALVLGGELCHSLVAIFQEQYFSV